MRSGSLEKNRNETRNNTHTQTEKERRKEIHEKLMARINKIRIPLLKVNII